MKTTKYRLRRGLNGTCVLQVLRDFPSCIGGQIDASLRVLEWRDVKWDHLPPDITVTDEPLVYMPERKAEGNPMQSAAPIAVELLIAACCLTNPHDDCEDWHTPAGVQWRKWLESSGLIDEYHRGTEIGRAYLQKICEVLPQVTSLPRAILPEREDMGL